MTLPLFCLVSPVFFLWVRLATPTFFFPELSLPRSLTYTSCLIIGHSAFYDMNQSSTSLHSTHIPQQSSLFRSCLLSLHRCPVISRMHTLIANILFFRLMKSFCLFLHGSVGAGHHKITYFLHFSLWFSALLSSVYLIEKFFFYIELRTTHIFGSNDLCNSNTRPGQYVLDLTWETPSSLRTSFHSSKDDI